MRELVVAPLEDRSGVLYFGGASTLELAEHYGTPLYVIDEERIRENYRHMFRAFRSHYSDVRVHYAVKANANLSVLSILRQEGAGADCSCPAEIGLARHAGFAPADILYTGAYPSREEVAFACQTGVAINLDSDDYIEDVVAESRSPVLSFRINPGMGEGKHRLVFAGPGAKFGLPEERAAAAFRKAREMGIKRFGIHMMAGSCVLDPSYFPLITSRLVEIAGNIASRVGISFEFIDVGGGFGVPYAPDEHPLPLEKVAAEVVAAFEKGCDRLSLGRPRLVVEPGRYLVCDAGILLTRVHVIKRLARTFVGVDAGMNTLLRPALYDAHHPILVANRLQRINEAPVDVVGPICENTDVLASDRLLPEIHENDLLAVLNAGAYGFAMSSQYNNRPRSAEVLVRRGAHEIVREREDFADLIHRQHLPGRLLR